MAIKYPLYKDNYDFVKVLKNFEDLKDYKFDYYDNKSKTSIYSLNIDYDRDERFLRITDYFSEECRIKCNFSDFISPYEYFTINKDSIIKNLTKEYSYKEIDNYIFSRGPRQCTLFNLIVCTSILRHFKPKRWLDPSAGWGDRLIAAINYGDCYYRATDPNDCLHPKYKEIIDTFAEKKTIEDERGSRPKYHITQEGFETAQIEAGYYDLVFTSPPFFDLEKYSNSPEQSHIKFATLEEWMNGFMYPFLIKAIASLQKDGHLCLYVADDKKKKVFFVNRIKRYLNENKRMKFIGNIFWQADTRQKNIMVFKKIKK